MYLLINEFYNLLTKIKFAVNNHYYQKFINLAISKSLDNLNS